MLYRDAGTGGARGHCPATLQYLADQLTLFQPGDGRLFSPINTLPPPHHHFSPPDHWIYIDPLISQIYIDFIFIEKATKICNIFPLLLTVCTVVKSKGKILQNFVVFSEYMNFRHEKRCQILQTLFWVFQYSRNSQWAGLNGLIKFYRWSLAKL